MLNKMNSSFNPKAVKMVMHGAALGLFANLLAGGTIGKPVPSWLAAVAAVFGIVFILRFFGKNQRLLELSLGIAMVIGMTAGAAYYYMTL